MSRAGKIVITKVWDTLEISLALLRWWISSTHY